MRRLVEQRLGSFDGLKSIEIGAGLGDFSLLLNWAGADTTLSDYSDEAISKAQVRFREHGATAQFVKADMLNAPSTLSDAHDISFSLGLAEHFEGNDRYRIIEAHARVLRSGGLTFISVPYRYSFPYRIWMAYLIWRDKWPYGVEIPFSKREIRELAEQSGMTTVGFIQSSFWADVQTFFPWLRIRRLLPRKINRPSVLDRFGYALVYVGAR
jgi:ubiquinone/menaquinone biosynthesis C-methylase UbiE